NTKGVVIDQSPQNLVGGTAPGSRNVIAGGREQASGHGVEITGWPALNALHNMVQGNYIGTDITGTQRLPNLGSGVDISYADASQIGGTAPGARNLISANLQYGVRTQTSSFVRVQGNILGPDITGTISLSRNGNDGSVGVALDNGTSNSVVGGSVAAARNLASGGVVGILAYGHTSFGNAILGNYVGTDPTGTQAVPNAGHGILVASPNTQVGGPGLGEGNLSSGNNAQSGACGVAIWSEGESCLVQGNILGLDVTGTTPLGNDRGLLINGGAYCRYGGTNPGEANVIAGNDAHGVWIFDPQGNSLPEQDASLDTPKSVPDLATTTSVISVAPSATNLLVSVKVNVALPHSFDGDLILTLIAPNGTRILLANRRGGAGHDYLTTQFDDLAATPIGSGAAPFNGAFQPEEPLSVLSGVPIGGTWTLEIADVAGGDAGFLLGWSLDLVYLRTDRSSFQSQLVGNFIGTNAAGASGLGNGGDGIFGERSNILTIGVPGGGNVISGNAGHGIALNATFCAGNVVQANLIGLKPDGVTPLGNGSDGIAVSGPVGLIGGPGAAFGNRIAWNAGAGVNVVASTLPRQTTIRVNSIHDNGGLGIDLAPLGVTANDSGDGDGGANQLQNHPVITGAVPSFMNSLLISGTLQSRPNSKYTVDVYGSPQADPSGSGEGRVWLGFANITTDLSGNASWTVLTQNGSVGLLAATATDFAGNTSEFSGLMKNPQEASPAKDMTVAIGAGGTLQIAWTPACGASDHVLYWGTVGSGMIGPGGLNWTSAACGLGTSGTAGVLLGNPPVGSAFYFVMVGQTGAVEGSYGQSSSGG
ncbi:MAG TPA: proprotein convertase P-domain-containing protein, partial [Candidatus Polarisedimenticolia bacterium]|nr:proprotein convertase P-domain-containing protein [Candidatus Polarisedimenticolia bacterium]